MFSIIVPVYNAEKYVRECIESVINQTCESWELLLVNDGSTDGSLEICKSFLGDERISVFSKKNEGLSATRNYGLSRAKGDYILFLDSDDTIEPDSLERFQSIINKTGAEVIAGYAYHFDDSGAKWQSRAYLDLHGAVLDGPIFYNKSLYGANVRSCAQYYITSHELINRADLRFEPGLLHEDEIWTPILLANAKSVFDDEHCFYNYRISNAASITRNPKLKVRRGADRVKVAKVLEKYSRSNPATASSSAFHDNIAAQYMFGVYTGDLLSAEDFRVERFFPLQHARTANYKLKAALFAFSPKMACIARGRKDN